MPRPQRTPGWLWAGRIAAGTILAGLTGYLIHAGLDDAANLASSISVVIAAAALLTPYLLPPPQPPSPPTPLPPGSTGQAVTGSSVGGDVQQVRSVGGSVRLGPGTTGQPPAGPPPPASSSGTAPAAAGSQVVDASTVNGSVTQVGDVSDDVDINR